MALQDAVPLIDDRRYDDIVEEIKTRIARYTPEWQPVWNDYNDSDPGITLAQLFAWLSEMLIYRMGKVPELNYIKFLQLLGIELRAAQPARIDVMFPVKEDATVPFVDVPIRTQVSAPADDGGLPVVYETEKSLRALTAQLMSVQAYDGAAHRDATSYSTDVQPFPPFGELARVDAALVLGFGYPTAYPKPDEFPATTFDLAFYRQSDTDVKPMVSCGLTPTVYAPAKVLWECWNGTEWQRIDVLKDDTVAFTRSGFITLRTPAVGVMKRDFMGAYDNDGSRPRLFWIRARLIKAQYETPPKLVAVRANTVTALQAQTVKGEVLGGTDGTRNQKWTFANTPVVAGSARVSIDDGTGAAEWQVGSDLLDAGPDDRSLALAPASGELTAGDGVHGEVPTANAHNPDANVIATEYRYGGGTRGNVRAGAINSVLSSVEGIDNGKVTNLFAGTGGRDMELLNDAKERARQTVRARCRAVSVDDFEYFAKQAGDIARAKALPLFHPQFPTVRVPGAITVVVVPNSKRTPDVPYRPTPSEGLLRTVCAYLQARRLLTTEVYVMGPRYQELSVDVQLVAKGDADTAAVRSEVEGAIGTYFDAILGGDDGTGWGFGETIRYSKVYQRILTIDGVDSISRLVLTLDGTDQPECKDVPIDSNSLLVLMSRTVDVQLDEGDAAA
jgi:predicted phage baseplate assembly protein